ncbi:protein prenyltransferase, alpha subunit [Kalymmatonema gypsitolerans NIES-4073]|nr:protein prenyltransferase, alpha subunit [Scytonema sp. NIES-4073]
MLRQFWQWLKRFFQRLFGSKQSPQSGRHRRVEPRKQPTDAEYEALFLELLAGVNEGWSRGRVKGFLDAKKITQAGLVEWLRRFGERLLVSTAPNDELAARMVQMGELGVGEVGDVARDIGMRVLARGGETNRQGAEDAEKTEEGDAEAWLNQGNEQLMAGDFAGAIASYDKALEIKPDFHEAWYNRGNPLFNLGRIEDVIASYDKALEIKPDFHEAWYNRGNALSNLGRIEDVIASYDKALEIKPDFHEAWYNRGNALFKLERHEDAIASYDKAIELKLDFEQACLNRGFALSKLKRYEEGITSFDKAIEFKPNSYEAWFHRGILLRNLGRYAEAIASYDKAIEFKPNDYEAWLFKGVVLCDQFRQYEEAITSFDKAIEFKPNSYEAWINRGIAAEKSVGSDQLRASLSAIIKQNPSLNQRGYEGRLASYEEGLKYCHQHSHPEGWGKLHQYTGKAHYFRGRGDSRPRSYWHKAVNSYNQALTTLT